MPNICRHRTSHLAICAALSIAADAAVATPLTVTNCYDDSRAGSLRTVIAGAVDGDTVDLSGLPGADPACTASKITLTQGQIPVSGALTIVGPGQQQLAIDGADASAIFYSTDGNAALTLRDITVTNGHNPGQRGGCVDVAGAVTLDGAAVTGCTLDAHGSTGKYQPLYAGAGIFASKVTLQNGARVAGNSLVKHDIDPGFAYGGGIAAVYLYCTDSSISGNVAVLASAAGAYVTNETSFARCTVDGNTASKYGGGLLTNATTVTIEQSTFSHNGAAAGGGIFTKKALNIFNSTIAFNYAGAGRGAGIDSTQDISLQSVIVASDTNQSGTPVDVFLASGKRINGAANLIMYTAATASTGVIVSTADPHLTPLGDHGGLTRTHALLATSAALDIGADPQHFANDQRGAPREVPSGKPDIGAYERQASDDELYYGGFDDS